MMSVTIFSLLYWTEDRRRVTEVALTLVFSESYDAFIVLLAEKRIYIKTSYLIHLIGLKNRFFTFIQACEFPHLPDKTFAINVFTLIN
ncbi:hypothetical protein LZF95_17285 [Algoriphagus sp. AGSA1]|uniref:hypothetical protein n=1 Tax=Algoriphagus sp. AGSA1 TaxID=2907213 RepID=UPI001F2528F9|nr:hypothetical protein [Algoriphagus sp. AGSA1]MCE7056441.1 hypothetical protein [Algoriphagus sp. AGSA1]